MGGKHFATWALVGSLIMISGCGGSGDDWNRVEGQSTVVNGSRVSTWARTDGAGQVQEVGVTFDAALIDNPPTVPGAGPAGASASLLFPEVVRNTTFFNNFQAHYEAMGHPPEVYGTPHWDLHFYGIPETSIRAIVPPDTVAPTPDRIPPGYIYAGVEEVVPEMGVHAVAEADFHPGHTFAHTMVMGYWGGQLIFVEPMITDAFFRTRQTWSTPVPQPAVLGRNTRYPTVFESRYNASNNTYTLVYSGFVSKT
jgi:hypothetical protein